MWRQGGCANGGRRGWIVEAGCAFWSCFGFFRWSDSRTWTDVPTEFLTYEPMYALLLRSDCLCQMEFMAPHDDLTKMGFLFRGVLHTRYFDGMLFFEVSMECYCRIGLVIIKSLKILKRENFTGTDYDSFMRHMEGCHPSCISSQPTK
jgi:hypothetical protein